MTSEYAPLLVDDVVSTQWLADHLGSERLIVLDATVVELPSRHDGPARLVSGYDEYLFDGHVPGAVFADLVTAFGGPDEPDRAIADDDPGSDAVRSDAEAIGVRSEQTIVVYDRGDGRFARRLIAALGRGGFPRVALLDGGLSRWRAESRETTDGNQDGSFTG